MNTKIFPYSLVRYASLHHEAFNPFTFKQGKALMATHQHHINTREELKNAICDGLFPIITHQTDDKLRQQLINLKRKVFNDKKITPDQLADIENALSKPISAHIKAYLQNETDLENLFHNMERLFNEEMIKARKLLQQMALKPELQNGLMLSSSVLYTQLKGFINKPVADFKQKELRMEFSLLRYLSRMAFKTSPFSSFTYTGVMTLAANGDHLTDKTRMVQSRLKLNNILFEYLRAVIKQHPMLNGYLFVKLNITAEIKSDKIHFLTNFNNIEAFQQLAANGLPLMVLRYLQGLNQPISLNKLLEYLLNHVESDRQTIKNYLIKLMETGLFELNFGFSGMHEQWDIKLPDFLKNNVKQEPGFEPLVNLFSMLQKSKDRYAAAEPAIRYGILLQAEQELNKVFLALQKEAGLPYYRSADEKKTVDTAGNMEEKVFLTNVFVPYYFTARHIFFEDCFTTETEVLPAEGVEDFITKTNNLVQYLSPLDVMRNESAQMHSFFLKHYKNHEKIALTAFYRAYYFHVKKPEKARAEKNKPSVAETTAWKTAFLSKLEHHEATREVINFTSAFFSGISTGIASAQNSSLGIFVQFYQQENQLHGVINSLLPGMGKVSGRFLSLFDSKIKEAFVLHNEALYPGVIKAELNDASTFNANIHPALLHHEIALPSGNNIYPSAQQIKVGDLTVSLDVDNKQLKLCLHNQQVFGYDLSLESFYNRSNLYQLLAHFNPDARISLQPFIQLVDQFYEGKLSDEEPDIFTLPRITFEETVVLRRKTWRVKTAYIPIQQQQEADFEYFIRLNNWLTIQKIPLQIFLFLRKRAYQVKPADGEAQKREGLHDDYKPQYLSFDKPLFVSMFKRLLARAGKYITMEEVLPIPDQDGVKEYLIQWYNTK